MAIDDPTKNCTLFFQLHFKINKCQLVGTDLEFIICPQHTRYPKEDKIKEKIKINYQGKSISQLQLRTFKFLIKCNVLQSYVVISLYYDTGKNLFQKKSSV